MPEQKRRKNDALIWTGIILFFIALTLFIAWPLPMHMDGFILPAEYSDISHSDTMQHILKIEEVKGRILARQNPVIADKTDVSQIYLFFGLVATEVLNVNPVVYHNLFFMAVIFLSGMLMYLFMFELSKDRLVSLFAGFIYASSYYIPYAYYWGHSNTMQIEWIPLVFLMLERTLRYQKAKDAIYLGLACALQVLSSSYTTTHLLFTVPLYLVLRTLFLGKAGRKDLMNKRIWLLFLLAIAVALASSSWYLVQKVQSEVIIRTLEENMMDYWRLASLTGLVDITDHLYLGIIQVLLIIAGATIICAQLIKWMRTKYSRRESGETRGHNVKNVKVKIDAQHMRYMQYAQYAPFILFFIMIIICTLGPFAIWAPYYWLFNIWPYFDHLRVPFRIMPQAIMAGSILAGVVLVFIKQLGVKESHRIALACLFIILMVIQILMSPWLSGLHIYYGT